MKRKLLLLAALLFWLSGNIHSQTSLTLEECYLKARDNYPLIKQKEYIELSKEFSVSNIWKGYLPQINISAQATYQSDVTSLPISFPGIKIESLTKDQYKTVVDLTQVIYDGGIMSSQAGMQKSIAESENQKLEIELLKVKERVTQIYFGILLLESQLAQLNLVKQDLSASLSKLSAALENGTATKTNVDILKAEELKTLQKEIELKSVRKNFIDILALLLNQKLEEPIKLKTPEFNGLLPSEELNRPELKLFLSQSQIIEEQNGLTNSKILPKASLFFQGGYGKPTLNMLKNEFDWYYITGVRVNWPLSNLYSFGNEKEILELNRKTIDTQRESFLLNTSINLKQYYNEIEKLNSLIEVDKKIIEIRTSVKESAKSQLENGVITSNDFIRELSAEDQARQNLAVHNIQLLLARQNYLIATGN
jgi:outer membrane protein TolC